MRKWHGTSYIKTGWSHEYANQPCQDAVFFVQTEHYILAAVSDGVGSLPNSQIASNATVEAVHEWFIGNLKDIKRQKHDLDWFSMDLIMFVRAALQAAAKRNMVELDTMDCNLAFAFILPGDCALFGSLGDCAVCVIGKESHVLTSSSALANGTDTILSTNSEQRLCMTWQSLLDDRIHGFLLTSDGLEGEIYYKNSNIIRKRAEAYFNALMSDWAQDQIESLVKELPDSFDDDISIAVLSCSTQAITLPEDPTWLCICETRNPITTSRCTNCNADFVELYKDIVQGKKREAFFAALNRNPAEERKRIGLPPLQVDIPVSKVKIPPTHQPPPNPPVTNPGINAESIEKLIADMNPDKQNPAYTPHTKFRKNRKNTHSAQNSADLSANPAENRSSSPNHFRKNFAIAAVIASLLLCVSMFFLLKQYRLLKQANQNLKDKIERYESLMENEYASRLLDCIVLMDELGCDESEIYTVRAAVTFIWDIPGTNGEHINSLSQDDVVWADLTKLMPDSADESIMWVKVTLPGGDTGWCEWGVLQPWLSTGAS